MLAYFNPYFGTNFFQFFKVLFERILGLFFGKEQTLVSDEIQMLVLLGVAFSSALVGCFLVLRRMTMLANALSHTILLGLVVTFFITHAGAEGIDLTNMMIASLLTGLLTTFLTEFFHKILKLQEDASIGLVFTTLFALGIILLTALTRNAHVGTDVVMGNVDALHSSDIGLVWWIALANLILTLLFFKEYAITTFDASLSRLLGISTLFFNYLLMIQVSATSIGAFRAVGVLMVLAFIVGPPLIARRLTHHLKALFVIAICTGSLASLLGVALSRHILTTTGSPLSTGGLIVCILSFFYLFLLLASCRKVTTKSPDCSFGSPQCHKSDSR